MIALFYLLALVALLVGTAAIYMALIEAFPVRWLYWHLFIRKPVTWGIFALTLLWGLLQDPFPWALLGPLVLMALAIVLTYRMHQSVAFPAIDFPPQAEAATLPLRDDMEIAVIDYAGTVRAYALDHLIHHHIINDRFGDRVVAVTFCAMCRSIIPFDVTEIGPLFVASFKNANMIVADRKTKTFFQQASFSSLIGRLHPSALTMIPFQIMTWKDLRESGPVPPFAAFTAKDLRDFELPIPGVWRKIMASEVTPGLGAARRDRSLPARTPVIGLLSPDLPPLAFRRDALRAAGVVHRPDLGITLASAGGGVVAFRTADIGPLELGADHRLHDARSGAVWTLRGKAAGGSNQADLEPVALSDEYWFSWKFFHPTARLERIGQAPT
ncbi:MAG: DUF3179 domain-containing protein [Rhodobacter sp.]|nr:DUF3179 domain-containing protein [Paracoccaceae bacterium]MCC0077598.1 DUF3179 domain-containing protein [Rhodobacter sp.]